jgi:hypothetical protein
VSRCLAAQSARLDAAVFGEAFKKAFPDRGIYEFDRLTFSQYQDILLSGDCWEAYKDEFDLPVERVRALLDMARNMRNQIAHNRGLPTPSERDRLVFCRDMFGQVADRRQDVGAATIETAAAQAAVAEPETAVDTDAADEADGEQRFVPWKWLVEGREIWEVIANFSAIESKTGSPLPPAARVHRSWWTNDEEAPQAVQWLDAGYRVAAVNLGAETVTFVRNTSREQALLEVFGRLLLRLGERPDWPRVPAPTSRTYQQLTQVTVDGCTIQLSIGFTTGDRFRVSLYLDGPDQTRNKAVYDTLAAHRDELERSVSSTLTWDRNPHRRASRVSLNYPREVSIMAGDEAIEQLAEWVAEQVPRFWTAVRERLGVSSEN